MKTLFAALLLMSMSVNASPSVSEDTVLEGFVNTATCASIVGGAALNDDTPVENRKVLKVAYYYYATLSTTAAEWLISSYPGWEEATYEEMIDMVVDNLEKRPKKELQMMGESCMDVFFEMAKEELDDKENPKIRM